MKILIVEDDAATAAYLRDGLLAQGHEVAHADNGRDGLFRASGETFDVLIVDRMLPELDGVGLVRRLREAGVRTPTLFLTALGGVDDRVAGLEAGADDYLVKPFAFAELAARLAALARRPPLPEARTRLALADLEIDLIDRKVTRAGRAIDLQPREFELLRYLVENAGRVVTRAMLLENVWEYHFDPKTNIVETHVSRLRAKVDKGFDADLIVTLRGAGYMIRDPA
ncbi:MAG: response regulator transcription factor [Methylobacteriaceae bacterium]|nr:response regulator transcription factor [Methylobacteriaceae bacterium]